MHMLELNQNNNSLKQKGKNGMKNKKKKRKTDFFSGEKTSSNIQADIHNNWSMERRKSKLMNRFRMFNMNIPTYWP